MNPFQKEYDEMIDILEESKAKIDAIDNEDVKSLKNRLTANIQRDINSLKARADRVDSIPSTILIRKSRPLRSFLGNRLPDIDKRKKPEIEKTALGIREWKTKSQETTEMQEGLELEKTLNRFYDDFPNMDNDQIRDKFTDIEIIGFARKAEFPVTEKTAVDIKLIEHIKKAIIKQKDLERKEKELNEKVKDQLKNGSKDKQ